MCDYYNRILECIGQDPSGLDFGEYHLYQNRNSDVGYWKVGKTTRKTITRESLCIAKKRYDEGGLDRVDRRWFNVRPESSSRPCNLDVMQKILGAFD